MKKLLVILLFIGFAIPTVVGATLWDYYSSKGQPLPSIKDRASIAASYGIYDYSGTAEENNLLESFLRMSLGAGNPVTATDWTLARRLTSSASDTTIYLTSIKDLRNNSIATSSLPYKVYLMIEAENSDNAEIVVCPRSGYDQLNKKFTSCTRGLAFYGNSESSDSNNVKEHSSGVSANMTNVGQFYNLFGGIWDDNFWYGLNTFASTTEATSQINIGTTTQAYFKNEGGVLYYCNNGASCAAIGAGANTYLFNRPLYLDGSTVKQGTSTSDFVLDGSSNLSIRKNNSITSNADGLAVATTSNYNWTGNHTFNGENAFNATTTFKNISHNGFGGNGTDGALSISAGATTTLDANYANVLVKNYTSINIPNTAGLTLSNSSTTGTILVLKSQGNCVIGGNIWLTGFGLTHGAGTTTPYGMWDLFDTDINGVDNGTAKAVGSVGGSRYSTATLNAFTTAIDSAVSKSLYLVPGTHGGDGTKGGGVNGGTAGEGGSGGGALIIECGGYITFTGSIVVDGGTGGTGGNAGASSVGGGGGGGGSAGMAIILYNGLISNTGIIYARGGAGGAGGTGTIDGNDGNAGGGGGGSWSSDGEKGADGDSSGAGTAGTATTDASGAGGGSGGGNGVGGAGGAQGSTDPNHYYIGQNYWF